MWCNCIELVSDSDTVARTCAARRTELTLGVHHNLNLLHASWYGQAPLLRPPSGIDVRGASCHPQIRVQADDAIGIDHFSLCGKW